MKSLFCVVFLCVGLVGCGSGASSATNSMANTAANSNKVSFGIYDIARSGPYSGMAEAIATKPLAQSAASAPETNADASAKNTQTTLAQTAASTIDTRPTDRKVIRNADLDLEAENPEDAQRKITSIAETRGGFVVESQQSSSEVTATIRDIVTITVRVPADKFSETLADIRNVSTRVVLESVKGQDVTEEFIDIQAQVKAKKALEAQFMEIMKRANTVEDALDVQRQLAEVRGEIERIEGRMRFLENQSSLSTIKIRIQTPKVFAQSSVGFGGRLAESFSSGADVAVSFILGLVTFVVAMLPLGLFVGLPTFVFIRYVWRRQSRPQSVIDLAEDELKST